jgi:thiol-disulfide isomerase/thioredoxin
VSEPPQRPAPVRTGALLAVLAMLALCAAGGFVLYRLTAPASSTLRPVSPDVAGRKPMTGPPEEPPRPAIPETVPPIELPGLDGKVHALADWRGRPLLINFWATWCEPCRREVPLLRALKRDRAAEGLEIVGVAIDSPDAVRQFIGNLGIDYPVLLGEKDGLAAITAFGMDTVLPFSVFADPSGRIVTVKVGELHRDQADLILDRLRQLDAGTLTLAAAREQISEGMRRLELARAARKPS